MRRTRSGILYDPAPVDRHHPLNQGRLCFRLCTPELTGGVNFFDLLESVALPRVSTSSWAPSRRRGGLGPALRLNATTAGASATTPPRLRIGLPLSLAMWIKGLGTPTDFGWFCGVTYDNADNAPFHAYNWSYQTSGGVTFNFNSNGGSVIQVTTGLTVASTTPWTRVLASLSAGGLNMYINGASVYSDATAYLDPIYDPTSLTNVGIASGLSRNANVDIDDVSIWARALSAADAFADYEQSLRGYPDVLNWLSPTTYSIPAGGSVKVNWHRLKRTARRRAA